MTHAEIMERLAALDREINDEFAKMNVQFKTSAYRPFPKFDWIFAALCLGWSMFGESIPYVSEAYIATYGWAYWLAVAAGALAALRTLLWFLSRITRPSAKGHGEASVRVKALQDERRVLQRQLRELEGE